jgi:Dolichyl-phosphate-mannose-protein mannosyltransferase
VAHSVADSQTTAGASTNTRRLVVASIVACAAIAGLVARVVVYRSSIGRVDADEAVWALMARDVAHGHISAFYWGQAYGGTQEVVLVGALFWAAGTHVFLMRLVAIVLAAATALVVWRIGRRTIGELPAVVAGCLVWIWPPYVIWKLDVWHGFYASGLLYSALIVLFVLRLDERPSRRDAALLGLLLGLGFWQTLQIVPIAAPALLWLTIRRPTVWRHAWVAVPAALAGALPWLLSNARHDWWSFRLPSDNIGYLTRLRGGIDATIPMQLSLRVPFSSEWLFGAAISGLIYAALIGLFLVFGWRTRRRRISLLFLIVAAYPFLYALSGLTWLNDEPRYVVLLVPALAVLFALPAKTLPRAALVLVVAGALSTAVLARWLEWSHDPDRGAALSRKTVDVAPAIAALDRAGIDRLYADYWIAYRITFETRERLIASEADLASVAAAGPGRVLPKTPRDYTDHRHPAYDTAVREADRHAYLLLRGEPTTAADRRLLVRNGYTVSNVGPFLLFASPPRSGG